MPAPTRLPLALLLTCLLAAPSCAPDAPQDAPPSQDDVPVSQGSSSAGAPSSEAASSGSEQRAAIPQLPDDLDVAVGGGGGFAGSWSETRMHADGWVVRYESRKPSRVLGRIKPGVRESLWRRLHLANYFGMKGRPGNMTTSVAVSAGGKRWNVSQEMGSPFDRLANQLAAELKSVEPAANKPKAHGDGLELQVALQHAKQRGPRPAEGEQVDLGPWSPILTFTITNRTKGALRVPNGRSTASYCHRPFGLSFELVDDDGEPWQPDIGAGGPAYPVSPEHFTALEPGASLTFRVNLGTYGSRAGWLWRTAGVYIVRASLRCPKGTAIPRPPLEPGKQPKPDKGPPIWGGETQAVTLTFRTE